MYNAKLYVGKQRVGWAIISWIFDPELRPKAPWVPAVMTDTGLVAGTPATVAENTLLLFINDARAEQFITQLSDPTAHR